MLVANNYYIQTISHFVVAQDNFSSVITNMLNWSKTINQVTPKLEAETVKDTKEQGLRDVLAQLLKKCDLQDILFMLFNYADEQARLAKREQHQQEALKWQKWADMLDFACETLEEDNLDESYYLIY